MEKYADKIIELTKKALKENKVTEELKQELEKELAPTGKLSKLYELLKDNELDTEKYEFMLKLISNDKELYEQIEKLRKSKEINKKKTDLENLKNNIEETKETIKRQIDNIELSTNVKTNIPLIKTIKKKTLERKNKDILKAKFEKIIETIEQSKLKTENKNLKEEYFEKENIKETLDLLYKHCQLGNIEEINNLGKELDEKYEIILNRIERDINKCLRESKERRKETESFDKRLREYTFYKQNNYVTLSIEHLSKKQLVNYNKNNKEVDLNISEIDNSNYKLTIYALIALYQIKKNENNKINITFIAKNIPEKTIVSKNEIKKDKEKKLNKKKIGT